MGNLIVDEGNTLCKIAVVENNEVVCESCTPEFDMAVATQLVEQPRPVEVVRGYVPL